MGAATGRGSRSRRRRSDLIRIANRLEEIQISGGPAWIESDRFAIEAATGPGVSSGDARAMIRAMLARRHSSTASSTTAATGRSGTSAHSRNGVVQGDAALGPSWLSARAISFEQFATLLSRTIRRPVIDRTNLTGPFDFDLVFQPESATLVPIPVSAAAPSIFTAVQEQLGLKLDPQRVPTDVIVIDSVERPMEN